MIVDAHTELYGVIGYPVKHSLSPTFQNPAFRYLGLNAVYLAFEIKPENLKEAIQGLKFAGVKGLNVTVPHKEAVMDLCDEMSPHAKEIGAVNTLKFGDHVYGDNTDWIGFMKAVKEVTSLKNKKVLLLGAGGSAKAVAYALAYEGAKVIVWNRTKEKALSLAKKYNFETAESPEEAVKEVDMVINTTSVGLKEDDPPLFDYELLEKRHIIMDIIYRETLLVRAGKLKGCKIVSGLSMLVYQGAESFKIWTGCEAPVKIMKRALKLV